MAAGDFGLELAALRAAAQMRPHVATAEGATVTVGELAAELIAAHLPPPLHLSQAEPCLVDGLSCNRRRGLEGRADLLEAETTELPHHQRPALALAQLA